jgi:hypothetical protein
MADVFLHVGLYKTGTTTIQGALTATAEQLAAAGVLFPGGHRAQRLAAYDLLGQRVGGELRGEAAGALGRLVDLVEAYDGPSVVVSEEELSLARPRQARRLVGALTGTGCTSSSARATWRGRWSRRGSSWSSTAAPPPGRTSWRQCGDRWARSYGERLVAELERREVTVHGDLADLVAPDHGRLFRRYRAAFLEREGRLPGPAEVLTSQLRAGGFWLRKRAVHHADAHPLVARASRLYLDRTSPSSRLAPGATET